jgi:hypothetical protein
MSLARLLNQPLTVQTVTTTLDDYGNAIPGPLGDPVAANGYLEQTGTLEYLSGRQMTVTSWTAYLSAGTSIHPMDYINREGQTFQVSGEPWHVYNPRTKAVHHIECKLTEVT